MNQLRLTHTAIPGLLLLELPVHADARGWFKEAWQREKMLALGLPDFQPVQANIAHNARRGTTRGFHAEPWDKLIGLASGSIFGAWVDLRPGPSFGRVVTQELGPSGAAFVPRGVANAYQSLVDDTAYCYLVNDHWSAAAKSSYTFVNLFEPELQIPWPLGPDQASVSEADLSHPPLSKVSPMPCRRTLITGAGGQLGKALLKVFPEADALPRAQLDIGDPEAVAAVDWSRYDTILNAAAYTNVDGAETLDGRQAAWRSNVAGVANLAAAARRHRLRLVHFSSDYVFDGARGGHEETEPFSPLGGYGQTKAAGDAIAATVPEHWIVRTSWVVGEGSNFVRTMAKLATSGVCPHVVDDQFGRLSFASDLAQGVAQLLAHSPSGTYHLSNAGPVRSWAAWAKLIFEMLGRSPEDVVAVSTESYAQGKSLAPRPQHSDFDLSKINSYGLQPADVEVRLREYLKGM